MISTIEHFSDFLGGDKALQWEKWSKRLGYFREKKRNVQKPGLSLQLTVEALVSNHLSDSKKWS